MTPDHEIDWTAAGKLAENWARLCYPETPEGNLARAYLDAMAQRDEAEKLRDVAYGLLDVAVKERDEALALLERAQECITPKYAGGTRACDEVLSGIRALLAKHRKTGANDGK